MRETDGIRLYAKLWAPAQCFGLSICAVCPVGETPPPSTLVRWIIGGMVNLLFRRTMMYMLCCEVNRAFESTGHAVSKSFTRHTCYSLERLMITLTLKGRYP